MLDINRILHYMVGNSLENRELPNFFIVNNFKPSELNLFNNNFDTLYHYINQEYIHLLKGQHNFLSFCVANEYYDLLYLFLNDKLYIDKLYINEESLVNYICTTKYKNLNILKWEINLIKLILSKNKQYAYYHGRHGFSILHHSIANKPYYFNQEIFKLLKENNINFSEILLDDTKRTPLFYSFINPQTSLSGQSNLFEYINFVRLIKLYLTVNDVSLKDINNDSILSYAIQYNCSFDKAYLMITNHILFDYYNSSNKYFQFIAEFEKRKLRNNKPNLIGITPLYLQ